MFYFKGQFFHQLIIVAILIRIVFHRVDEIGQNLFFFDLYCSEVEEAFLCELSLVHSWSRRNFVEFLVSSQRLHLQ